MKGKIEGNYLEGPKIGKTLFLYFLLRRIHVMDTRNAREKTQPKIP